MQGTENRTETASEELFDEFRDREVCPYCKTLLDGHGWGPRDHCDPRPIRKLRDVDA